MLAPSSVKPARLARGAGGEERLRGVRDHRLGTSQRRFHRRGLLPPLPGARLFFLPLSMPVSGGAACRARPHTCAGSHCRDPVNGPMAQRRAHAYSSVYSVPNVTTFTWCCCAPTDLLAVDLQQPADSPGQNLGSPAPDPSLSPRWSTVCSPMDLQIGAKPHLACRPHTHTGLQ